MSARPRSRDVARSRWPTAPCNAYIFNAPRAETGLCMRTAGCAAGLRRTTCRRSPTARQRTHARFVPFELCAPPLSVISFSTEAFSAPRGVQLEGAGARLRLAGALHRAKSGLSVAMSSAEYRARGTLRVLCVLVTSMGVDPGVMRATCGARLGC